MVRGCFDLDTEVEKGSGKEIHERPGAQLISILRRSKIQYKRHGAIA
jgi:hypothetical protein